MRLTTHTTTGQIATGLLAIGRTCLVLFLSLALASCGGSSPKKDDGGGSGDLRQFFSLLNFDGEICFQAIDSGGDVMRVGRLANGDICVAFCSFDISEFNVNDNVNVAGVEVHLIDQIGSPFNAHGDIIVSDVDLGGSLDLPDRDASAVTASTSLNSFTFRAVVTSMVQTAIEEGQNRISFRLQFANPSGAGDAFASFSTANDGNLPAPRLDIDVGTPNE